MYDKKRAHEENKEDGIDAAVEWDDITEEVTSPPSPTSIAKIVSWEIEPVLDKWVQLETIKEDEAGKIKSSLSKIVKAADGQQKKIRAFERDITVFNQKEKFFINTYEKQLFEQTKELEEETEQLKFNAGLQEDKIEVNHPFPFPEVFFIMNAYHCSSIAYFRHEDALQNYQSAFWVENVWF
jgi:hypothetical protein